MEIVFKPIGFIRSPYKDRAEIPKQGAHTETEGEVILQDELIRGLKDLDSFEHIVILFNFHGSEGYELLQHRRGDRTTEPVGVFATRSPFRPNGIGMSIVKVVDIAENRIRFKGVDMLDGTPVLDIKPYIEGLNPGNE